jgi:hypothetical protein
MHIGVDSLGLAGAYTAGVSLCGNANSSNVNFSNGSLSNGPVLDLCCGSGIQVSYAALRTQRSMCAYLLMRTHSPFSDVMFYIVCTLTALVIWTTTSSCTGAL